MEKIELELNEKTWGGFLETPKWLYALVGKTVSNLPLLLVHLQSLF